MTLFRTKTPDSTVWKRFRSGQDGFTVESRIEFDQAQPDGTSRKLMDCTRQNDLAWRAKTQLSRGLGIVYEDLQRRLAASSPAQVASRAR